MGLLTSALDFCQTAASRSALRCREDTSPLPAGLSPRVSGPTVFFYGKLTLIKIHRQWQCEGERRPLSLARLEPDLPAVPFHQPTAEIQPQASTADTLLARIISPDKASEDMRFLTGGNAAAAA